MNARAHTAWVLVSIMSNLPGALEERATQVQNVGRTVTVAGSVDTGAPPNFTEAIRLVGLPKASRVYTLTMAREGVPLQLGTTNRGRLTARIQLAGGAANPVTFEMDVGPGAELIVPASTVIVQFAWTCDAATLVALPSIQVSAWLAESVTSSNAPPVKTTLADAANSAPTMPLIPTGAINFPVPPFAKSVRFLRITQGAPPTLQPFTVQVRGSVAADVIDIFSVALGAPMTVYQLPTDCLNLNFTNTGAVNIDTIRAVFELNL